MQKKNNEIKRIVGKYELSITLEPPHKRLIDLGNFEKVVSDLLQRLDIIDDDHFCQKLTMEYGVAPLGCRVVLQPYP
jgi:hypothetical protein